MQEDEVGLSDVSALGLGDLSDFAEELVEKWLGVLGVLDLIPASEGVLEVDQAPVFGLDLCVL